MLRFSLIATFAAASLMVPHMSAEAGHHKAGEVHYKAKSATEVRAEREQAEEKKALIESRKPVANPGKIVVVYKNACKKFSQQDAMRTLNKIIAHERANSPVSFASSAVIFEDGEIGAIDTHMSIDSYNQAMAWQNSDAEWQRLFQEVLTTCAITADDVSITMGQIQ